MKYYSSLVSVMFKAVYRWLNQQDSGVSGARNANTRKDIVQVMRKLKFTSTVMLILYKLLVLIIYVSKNIFYSFVVLT